jgi:hypothetical protein
MCGDDWQFAVISLQSAGTVYLMADRSSGEAPSRAQM